jgi:trimethylamine--corrinoid protein Co-methyltransferase
MLNPEEMEAIHRAALEVLDTVGMRIDCDEALDYLAAVGCRIDRERKVVQFPPEVGQRFTDKMKQDYADPARVPEQMAVRYSRIYFTTRPYRVHSNFTVNAGGFVPFIYDLEGNRRLATLSDVRAAIRLADALEHIDFMGLPCAAQEIPAALRPVAMAAELVKNTTKLGGIETFTKRDVQYLTRIAEVVAGSREALRRKPILVGYAEARSPLCLDRNMAEIMIEYVRQGFPQSLDTMPNGGATAPVTPAGALALGVAETLGGLVLGYAVDENAVMSVDVCPSVCDMRTCLYPYASPERWSLIVATTQMITDYYRRPGGCHGGKTDACQPGVQAGVEKALSMLLPVLAGAVGIGTVGHIENAVTYSPLQLVIDNEIAGYVKHLLRGFEVNEETLAVDVIREVGIGGNYLGHPHTARHFREVSFLSPLFERFAWAGAQREEFPGLERKARQRAEQLMQEERPRPLTPEQEEAIDEIVEEARREVAR